MVGQILGDFQAREENLSAYLQKTEELLGYFVKYKLEQIPRELNESSDALASLALETEFELGRLIPVELLNEPNTSITE